MLNEKLKVDLKGIRFEIIDLNQKAYFYVRKINRFDYILKNTTRQFVLEELFSLRSIENDLILHLTKLDDDSSAHSFRQARKEINKISTNQKELKIFSKKLDGYRQSLSELKNNHRNARIAHINSTEHPDLDEFLNFATQLKPLILEANSIADILWGERINVKFKLGSLEGIIDFRAKVEELKVETNEVNGFN